jgi:ElaB/YqjD/DUF883 family membrane-anchored ribosome-binding protein
MTEYAPGNREYEGNDKSGKMPVDTEQLRAEIAETRDRVAEDLSALSEKLSRDHVREVARDAMRDTAQRVSDRFQHAGSSVAHFARDNAVPLALMGAGIGWMIVGRTRSARRRADELPPHRYEPRYRYEGLYDEEPSLEQYPTAPVASGPYASIDESFPEGGATSPTESSQQKLDAAGQDASGRLDDTKGQAQERWQDVKGQTQERFHGMKGQAQERFHGMKGQAQERFHGMKGNASERWHGMKDASQRAWQSTRDRSGQAWHSAVDAGHKAEDQFERLLQNNPLAVGAVALAAGVGLGLLLPRSGREDRLLGEKRDKLLEQARERARGAQEDAKHVMESAARAASDAASAEASQRFGSSDSSSSESDAKRKADEEAKRKLDDDKRLDLFG